ncbi:P-loop containing nucleoside triphosphate hydrolase protein [Hygrophoropsis aurantiaca]|uniref:P-loop containing nucleoside triphosphate hydrolase protein n=1 Tax=Hygrophoropsis aurantiaca TaxID=72124 RepID=A0ACB8A0S3_9AGAM|nr:P-loop containing nucleoside triphosphate hydrolase protein [Hygrophoropsis aurantiaca]
MPPPKGTRHRQKTRRLTTPDGSKQTPTNTPALQEGYAGLDAKIEESFGWAPREFQMRAILAQLQRRDVLVHAGTGAGKTAIAAGPHVHPSTLHDEQVETFRTEFKLSATAVNSSNGGCNREVLQKIVNGTWQIVLISPEMLLSRRFVQEVLQNVEFGRRILSVVVDEAHVVLHWGAAFRKQYGTLGKVRYFLPQNTPFVAVSATLPARVRNDVLDKLEFAKNDYVSIDIGNDRPNVSIVVRGIQHPMNTYANLDFIIPKDVSSPSHIQQTFIYADNIAVGTDIVDHITELLPDSLQQLGLIRPYNAAHSKKYRQRVMEMFRRGEVRVLVCTDAAGMGCNIPNIDLVVQWKLPASVSTFIQRAGRAACTKDRTGLAVLLVEQSAYEQDPSNAAEMEDAITSVTMKGGKNKGKKKRGKGKVYAQTRGSKRGSHDGKQDTVLVHDQARLDPQADDEGLLVFVQTGTCRRKVLTEIYKNGAPQPTVPCCDICDPSLLDKTRPGIAPTVPRQTSVKRGQVCEMVQDELHNWRKDIRKRDFANTFCAASGILSNETINLLSAVGPVTSREKLEKVLAGQWSWYSLYGEELFKKLSTLTIPPMVLLPKKPRGKKRQLEESQDVKEPADIRNQPLIQNKHRMAVNQRRGHDLQHASLQTWVNTSHMANETSSTDITHSGNASFVVPSMYEFLVPWNSDNVPSDAYNPRLWHPFSTVTNPYLIMAPIPPQLLIIHPP